MLLSALDVAAGALVCIRFCSSPFPVSLHTPAGLQYVNREFKQQPTGGLCSVRQRHIQLLQNLYFLFSNCQPIGKDNRMEQERYGRKNVAQVGVPGNRGVHCNFTWQQW